MLLSVDVTRLVPNSIERSTESGIFQFTEKIKIRLITSLGGFQTSNHGHGVDGKEISPENGEAGFAAWLSWPLPGHLKEALPHSRLRHG